MHDDETSRRSAGARTSRMLDTLVACGPLAAHALAAEERHQQALHKAAVWAATDGAAAHQRGAWRCRLGLLLIRAGNRLQGGTPPVIEAAGTAD